MGSILQFIKTHSDLLMKLLPLIAFAIPFLWLYFLDAPSFELMWKGRTFQLFFIWLISLELILGWENLQENRIKKLIAARTLAFSVAMVLPTIFVAASFYGGLNAAIENWSVQTGITWANSMPLSTEYLVFTVLFCLLVFLLWGFKGLKDFSVPAFFLAIVGVLYTIDNVLPYGQFTPFQIFVPTTTALASAFLNLMGYTTSMSYGQNNLEGGNMPFLTATNPNNPAVSARFAIAWPCAGIESFLIFTVVILLFLKRMPISWRAKIGYFAIGAAVTYVINALRIVNIFILGMNYGETSNEVQMFHFYYGPLYAVAWIVSYPLLIMGSITLWQHIKNRRDKKPAGNALQETENAHRLT
jgi:exosortase/archaeosortase family protein